MALEGLKVRITWPGNPMTWKRTNSYNGRRLTPKEMRNRKAQLAQLAMTLRPPGWPMDAAYKLTTYACKKCKKRTYPGDFDNLEKLGADAMEGVLYDNDRRIIESHCRKLIGPEPYTVFEFEVIDEMSSNCHFGKEGADDHG